MPSLAQGAHPAVPDEELRARYAAYRRRQATGLVHLLPREAVRPLYRRAAERERAEGREIGQDPLSLLVDFCEDLLPLPPFDRWCADFVAHAEAHLEEMAAATRGPTADAPATLEVRPVEHGGRRWRAHLRSFRDGEVWRGYIAFEDEVRRSVYSTAAVFCERDPIELRQRFEDFEPKTLEAFLRSSLL